MLEKDSRLSHQSKRGNKAPLAMAVHHWDAGTLNRHLFIVLFIQWPTC